MNGDRPSDSRAGDRSCRSLGRRRLDCLGGPGRRAARRPEERRRRPRPGLLRPRRHRADRHRLQPAARLSRQGIAARRASCRSIMRRPRRPSANGSPSRSVSTCARPRPRSSTSSITPWRKCSRSCRFSAATIRASFALAAFGGAGPLHAAALASELGIAEIICPPIPGRVLGARAHRHRSRRDYVQTRLHHAAAAEPHASGGRVRRPGDARSGACSSGPASRVERRRFERSVDARYPRQSYELAVPVPARPVDAAALGEIARGISRSSPAHLRS